MHSAGRKNEENYKDIKAYEEQKLAVKWHDSLIYVCDGYIITQVWQNRKIRQESCLELM